MNTDLSWDLGLACIVCILYIVGKVWVYYKIERNEYDNKDIE
jgi:hypothetical protein